VIAWNCGAVAEVIEDGVTGYIVESEAEALAALARVDELDRRRVRAVFERRFTSTTMARAYLELYADLIRRPLRRVS
jgi:glycosyltransferase involved in cell wall biosynthesis